MPVLKNTRQEKHCHNRAKGMKIEDAHAAAGYKRNRHNAASLDRKKHIITRIAELSAPAVQETQATVERVLREMTRLAFYDMTAVIEADDGKITLRDPTSLPEDLRRAIVGIKPVQVGEGMQYECKFADKQKALDSLARHLQMFKDTVIIENVFRIVSEMEDDELDRRLTELERAFDQAKTLDSTAGEGPARLH